MKMELGRSGSLGGVGEGHEQAHDREREREDGQLQVEAVPAALPFPGGQRADARRLEAKGAHQLFWL